MPVLIGSLSTALALVFQSAGNLKILQGTVGLIFVTSTGDQKGER